MTPRAVIVAGAGGPRPAQPTWVEPELSRLFSRRDATRLRRYLNARLALPAPPGVSLSSYPYRYRGLDPHLPVPVRGARSAPRAHAPRPAGGERPGRADDRGAGRRRLPERRAGGVRD